MISNATAQGASSALPIKLDPVSLVVHASGPVFVVVWTLVAAAVMVWIITALKLFQLSRLSRAERRFQAEAVQATSADQLFALGRRHAEAPGARVVLELSRRSGGQAKVIEAAAKRALVTEQQRVGSLMATLSSIAAAGPFVGLFGTVYGIMDAFLRIGQEKSASLPVVAPAIGEALIATAIGLFAAIPAVIAYNAINKRAEDLLAEVEASSEGWIAIAGASSTSPAPAPAY
ncbi:MotA/TolQ/ExbB proton channel family protein [Minicystis rosea]|nr:MotA/TolQ/ExbB proton channel family protein [Minicystis rosea]